MALGEFVEDHRRERDPSVIGRALPAVVDGVPLLDLARLALGAAEAYGVTRPAGVRAVVTTQTALDAQWPTAPEAAGPAYVVVELMEFASAKVAPGRFSACSAASEVSRV